VDLLRQTAGQIAERRICHPPQQRGLGDVVGGVGQRPHLAGVRAEQVAQQQRLPSSACRSTCQPSR
jgi:hypothetical protein